MSNNDIFNINTKYEKVNEIVTKMQQAFEKDKPFEEVVYDKDFELKLLMLDYETEPQLTRKDNELTLVTTLYEANDILNISGEVETVYVKQYSDIGTGTILRIRIEK